MKAIPHIYLVNDLQTGSQHIHKYESIFIGLVKLIHKG